MVEIFFRSWVSEIDEERLESLVLALLIVSSYGIFSTLSIDSVSTSLRSGELSGTSLIFFSSF